jgi:hypothetical protein
MMRTLNLLTLVLCLGSFNSFADEKADAAMKQEMEGKFKILTTPTDAHKKLALQAGNWTYTTKSWHTPESQPESSPGTSVMKMVLGGKYLQQDAKGTAMGMPYEGMGLIGYDTLKKRYDTIWLDNMSTAIVSGHGELDQKNQILKDQGEFTCPMEKDLNGKYRAEWKMVDQNNMIYTMFMNAAGTGKEFKMMEITYKRVK